MNFVAKLATAAAVLAFTAPAHAVPTPTLPPMYSFAITGDYTATFSILEEPTPNSWIPGYSFTVTGVTGLPTSTGDGDLSFYTAAGGGGFGIFDFFANKPVIDTVGPQLFEGPVTAPKFKAGTYALTGFDGVSKYTLTISAPVPEPATWAMMIGGLALVGATLRRRSGTVHFA